MERDGKRRKERQQHQKQQRQQEQRGSTTSKAIMKEHSWPNRVAIEIVFQLLRPEPGVSLHDDRIVAVPEEPTLHLESYN